MIRPSVRRAALTAVILAGVFSRASGQASTGSGANQSAMVGHVGITAIECDCTFDSRDSDARIFRFRSNPVIVGVAPRGPSAEILFPGDTILDINGTPLRTPPGGSSFANIRPGQRVTLGLRRAGRAVRVSLRAAGVRADDPSGLGRYMPRAPSRPGLDDDYGVPSPRPAPRAVPATPAPTGTFEGTPPPARSPRAMPPDPGEGGRATPVPRVPRSLPPDGMAPLPPVPVPLSEASPKGWFGFSIRCSQCGWALGSGDASPRWESSTPPEIGIVSPDGPAAAAGFRTGDRITHVDGRSILEPEGARRFGAVVPGERIRLTVDRNGTTITRQLTLADRPRPSSGRSTLRYTGRLSDVDIQVWSAAAATVQREGDTITISVGGSTVRLKTTSPRARD